jgi:hypothetical protein
MDGPTESVWRAQQEAAARFSQGWRELLESAAGRTTGTGVSPGLPDPLQVLTRSAADYAAVRFSHCAISPTDSGTSPTR